MNVDDVMFLLAADAMDERLNRRLRQLSVDLRGLGEEDTDELRDWAGELLQMRGFDEDYATTPDGERLERIIDELFRS